jgi:hypothetical protein
MMLGSVRMTLVVLRELSIMEMIGRLMTRTIIINRANKLQRFSGLLRLVVSIFPLFFPFYPLRRLHFAGAAST